VARDEIPSGVEIENLTSVLHPSTPHYSLDILTTFILQRLKVVTETPSSWRSENSDRQVWLRCVCVFYMCVTKSPEPWLQCVVQSGAAGEIAGAADSHLERNVKPEEL